MDMENKKRPNIEYNPNKLSPESAGRATLRAVGIEGPRGDQRDSIEVAHEKAIAEEAGRSFARARQVFDEETQRIYPGTTGPLNHRQVQAVSEAAHDRLDPKKGYENGGDYTAQLVADYAASERLKTLKDEDHQQAGEAEYKRSFARANQLIGEEAQRLYPGADPATLTDDQVDKVAQAAYSRVDPEEKTYEEGGDYTVSTAVAYLANQRLEHKKQ